MPGPYLTDEQVNKIRKMQFDRPRKNGKFQKLPHFGWHSRATVGRMASNNGKKCFHHDLPKEILESLNQQLRNHVSYKKISAQIGFSHSSIWRHNVHCVRAAIVQAHGDKIRSFSQLKPITVWPALFDNGPQRYFLAGREISMAEANSLSPNEYFFLVVRYHRAPHTQPNEIESKIREQPREIAEPFSLAPGMLTRHEAKQLQQQMESRAALDAAAEIEIAPLET